MSHFIKVEKDEYENIPNLVVKQELTDVNVNYHQRDSYEKSYWKKKCEVLQWKVSKLESENESLKAKRAAPSKPSAPYSDPLLKALGLCKIDS